MTLLRLGHNIRVSSCPAQRQLRELLGLWSAEVVGKGPPFLSLTLNDLLASSPGSRFSYFKAALGSQVVYFLTGSAGTSDWLLAAYQEHILLTSF